MVVVKRALLSCHDKTGLEVFAKGLAELGVELVASQGTAAFLQQHGLRVKTVEAFAGIAEQLDGRVKTLHPRIHAGILARRDDPAHVQAVGAEGLIDLVVVNLYPFQEATQTPNLSVSAVLEQIDIGGVALLRAAAKNFPHVAVASAPAQYPEILAALRRGRATLSVDESRALAATAFHLTSRYDRWITAYLGQASPPAGSGSGAQAAQALSLPEQVTVQAGRHQALRYGENPHQQAGWYVPLGQPLAGLATLASLQGKELSCNNLLDVDAAVRCLLDFEQPTCVIVKHASPCGIASARTVAEAYQRALACDAESAFGGIVGFNHPLDGATASQMASTFLEVIVAPAVESSARMVFAKKSNLRVIELADARGASSTTEWRSVLGGWLIQEQDRSTVDASALRVVTARRPTPEEQRDLLFAWIAAKHVKSNAIVLAKDEATLGIGQGQPSRVRAVRLAIQNAGARAQGAVLASDGFFPFPDNVELAARAGIAAIMQPGGSVKDADVIAAADAAGLAMVFTGLRHFRH
jgi:phosphoribosylaminoimidazolecarboxamide formyltransferase/IMP cyclohydrolase